MDRIQELQKKHEAFQTDLDIYFKNLRGEGYYHDNDYQKNTDLASHISKIIYPEADDFNIIIDYFSFPYSINWTDYFKLFFSFHTPHESLLNFYRFCIEEIDKLRVSFEEFTVIDAFENDYLLGEYSKKSDKRISLNVINNLKIKTYNQTFEENPLNNLKLIELKVLILEKIIEIKDGESNKLLILRDNKKLVVLNGLKPYFIEDDYSSLEKALDGNLLDKPIFFKSRQTYLIEFFRRLEYHNVIETDRPKLIKWLNENFKYKNPKVGYSNFKKNTIIAYLNEVEKAKQHCTIKPDKMILSNKFPYLSKEEIKNHKAKYI